MSGLHGDKSPVHVHDVAADEVGGRGVEEEREAALAGR